VLVWCGVWRLVFVVSICLAVLGLCLIVINASAVEEEEVYITTYIATFSPPNKSTQQTPNATHHTIPTLRFHCSVNFHLKLPLSISIYLSCKNFYHNRVKLRIFHHIIEKPGHTPPTKNHSRNHPMFSDIKMESPDIDIASNITYDQRSTTEFIITTLTV
jgi:hypothetical protein